MPQLGPCGLSENWLLRHLGDLHWQGICEGLGEMSRHIRDEDGNRLYASFVRVSWSASLPLSQFGESDELNGSMRLTRCGEALYMSKSSLRVAQGAIEVEMASIFSRRDRDNSNERLLPSTPNRPAGPTIPDLEELPTFVSDHRRLRNGILLSTRLQDREFDLRDPPTEFVQYPTNGYFDFNGANLLYFASYPTIADVCASNSAIGASVGFERFVTKSSPIARDVFYFANANLGESLACGITAQMARDAKMSYRTDMAREDGTCISRQFVLRENPGA
jgi:probable biosynthetic protein (TIGR04098 family)